MNKKILMGVVGVIVVLLVVGGILFMTGGKKSSTNTPSYGPDQSLPKISADAIGFTVTMPDKQHVQVHVTKTQDIKHLSSDIIYDAYARDENNQPLTSDPKINRDVLGEDLDISSGKVYDSKPILLGSCSTGGKCVYDIGTTKVTVDLKFTKTDGTQYQSEYIFNVPQQ